MAKVVEWSTMIEDVKKYIVGLLDYESRCNLRMCSKSDLAVVDSVKFKASSIAFIETEGAMDHQKTIIRLNIDTFTVWFIGKNDVTKVDRAWNGELSELSERKQENRYEVARRYIDRHFPDGVIAATEISVSDCKLHPSEHWKLKCADLELSGFLDDEHVNWLKQSVHAFRRLTVSPFTGDPLTITPDLLTATHKLRLNWKSDMTDEQLEQVKTVDLDVFSPHITPEAVTKFIARFLKFGKREDCMQLSIPLPEDFDYDRLIPKSVKFRKIVIPDHWISFEGKIVGGFSNEHGVQDVRRVYVVFESPERTNIRCYIEEDTHPCALWPFTHH